MLNQELQIFADQYTQTTAGLIPTVNAPVKGTGFDFTELRPIGAKADLMKADAALAPMDNWYDHNFVLRGKAGELKPACKMRDPVSGRTLEIWTTEPGMQMYGAQNMTDKVPAKAAGKNLCHSPAWRLRRSTSIRRTIPTSRQRSSVRARHSSPTPNTASASRSKANMHVVVCVKQVPDTTNVRINPKTNTLMREGVESIVNPFDEYALEEGLRLKDKLGARVPLSRWAAPGGHVAARGPCARRGRETVLVSSRAFGGADTLATSYTLSQAIKKAVVA